MSREELLHIIEKISVFLSLASLPLGVFRYMGYWPMSLFMSVVNMGIYYERGCYLRCATGSLNIIIGFYGWHKWKVGAKSSKKKPKIEPTSLYTWLMIGLGAFVLFLCLANSLIYIKETDWFVKNHSSKKVMTLPYLSAFMTVMVLVGQWLSAHKKLETYLFWALFNVISIYYHWQIGSFLSIKYIAYLGVSLYSFFVWKRAYKEEQEEAKKR